MWGRLAEAYYNGVGVSDHRVISYEVLASESCIIYQNSERNCLFSLLNTNQHDLVLLVGHNTYSRIAQPADDATIHVRATPARTDYAQKSTTCIR